MMNVHAGRGKLYSALKNLRARWEQVQDDWLDVVQKEFADQVWEPLDAETAEALQGIDRLQQVLIQVRQECEGMNDSL